MSVSEEQEPAAGVLLKIHANNKFAKAKRI
jgi:hypothetical protein